METIILPAIILSGLLIFQTLISIEAYMRVRRDVLRWTAINWFPYPKTPQSYQRRQQGVQTLLP